MLLLGKRRPQLAAAVNLAMSASLVRNYPVSVLARVTGQLLRPGQAVAHGQSSTAQSCTRQFQTSLNCFRGLPGSMLRVLMFFVVVCVPCQWLHRMRFSLTVVPVLEFVLHGHSRYSTYTQVVSYDFMIPSWARSHPTTHTSLCTTMKGIRISSTARRTSRSS
jgi:hypothetical protein